MDVNHTLALTSRSADIRHEIIAVCEELPQMAKVIIEAIGIERLSRFCNFLQQLFCRNSRSFERDIAENLLILRFRCFRQRGPAAPLEIMSKLERQGIFVGSVDPADQEVS